VTEERERFVIRTAAGYDVVEGRLLSPAPLDRAAADRLAHEPKAAATDLGRGANAPKSGANAPRKPKPTPPSPPMTREEVMRLAAAKANAEMDAANARPIPAAAFEVERAHQRSGSSGFSVNGVLLSGRKPQ
jgi:hypothetical protein